MATVTMPAAGYKRPDRVGETGLIVTVTGTSGEELGPFDFSDTPAHGSVRAELIAAFVTATEPDGRWRSGASMTRGYKIALTFLRSLDRLRIDVTSLEEFGPEDWWTWRADRAETNRWPGQINIMRVLLRESPKIPPLTRRALNQRTHKPRQRLYGSYSVSEFERLRRRSKELVLATERRIATNTAVLDAYLDDRANAGPEVKIGKQFYTRGELLHRLVSSGRLTFGPKSRALLPQVSQLLATGDLHPTYALFPTRCEILAVMVLLVCDQGYNISTMESLTVPELASGASSAGNAVLVEHLDKPRRGNRRFFTNSFTGKSARVLQQAVTITAPARECLSTLGHPTDRLLISGTSIGVTDHPTRSFVVKEFTQGGSVRTWDELAGLKADDGSRLHLHFNRLRLSEQVINRKSSQNSDAVSQDVYRRPDALTAHLVEDVILQGQAEAVSHAASTLKMRFVSDAGLAAPDLGRSTRADLDGGLLDTATGACLDFNHSPFADDGPCTASFLMCLACPNAIATPAHLPRLVTLRDALTNLASIDPERWSQLYSAHFDRLNQLLSSSLTEAEVAFARRAATDADRAVIERLLSRELDV